MSEVYKVEGPGCIAPGTKLVLKSDLDAVVNERDEARATKDLHKERTERAEAERDSERERHLITQRKLAEMWAERDALAATATFPRCRECGKWKQP
jgi:hypothetical protein